MSETTPVANLNAGLAVEDLFRPISLPPLPERQAGAATG